MQRISEVFFKDSSNVLHRDYQQFTKTTKLVQKCEQKSDVKEKSYRKMQKKKTSNVYKKAEFKVIGVVLQFEFKKKKKNKKEALTLH